MVSKKNDGQFVVNFIDLDLLRDFSKNAYHNNMIGSVETMGPEVINDKMPKNHKADNYALGVILY